MNVATPYTALTGRLEGEVLTVLLGTTRPMTGRQVHRMVRRGSDRGVRLLLNRFAEHGLVDVVEAPPARLYSLNRDHIAISAAEALVGMRRELLRRLREGLGHWEVPAVHASMFGSAARGDGDTSSDIDLLVIRPAGVDAGDPSWRAQLDGVAEHVLRWTGNHTAISELPERELPTLVTRRPAILDELEQDAITLAGADIGTVLASRDTRR